MEWYIAFILAGLLLIFVLVSGIPIGFGLCLIGVGGCALVVGLEPALSMFSITAYRVVASYGLVCIPLFILMAELFGTSGLTSRLFDAASAWLGRLPGGLAIASVFSCAVFAAISGTSIGTAATIGVIAIPEMRKRGYDRRLATGSVAGAGALGMLIPPSVPAVMIGIVAEQSIGKLLIGGIIPGIMLATIFMIYIAIRVALSPEIAPRQQSRTPLKEKLVSLKNIWPVLAIIVMVLGGIYTGVFTPTEAAAAGALGSLLLAVITRRMTWHNLAEAIWGTVQTTCMIGLLIIGAMSFGYLLTLLGVISGLSSFVAGLEVSRWVVVAIIMLTLIVLGCLLDVGSLILITAPIFFPIIIGLGFDPIWFGVLFVINLETAVITPPVGLNLYVIKGIAPDVYMGDILRGIVPFFFLDCLAIAIVMVFPELITWLPSLMK